MYKIVALFRLLRYGVKIHLVVAHGLTTILLFSNFSCDQDQLKAISFETYSRGFREEIKIAADSIWVRVDSFGNVYQHSRRLNPEEWTSLNATVENVQIDSIGYLQAPSTLRYTDAARHSQLSLETKKGAFTHEFDNENPHPTLSPAIDLIIQLASRRKPAD